MQLEKQIKDICLTDAARLIVGEDSKILKVDYTTAIFIEICMERKIHRTERSGYLLPCNK